MDGKLYTLLRYYLQISSFLTGTVPWSRYRLATVLLRLAWLCWLCAIVVIVIYLGMNGGDYSVSGLVGAATMLFQVFTYVVIIFEDTVKFKYYAEIQRLENEVDAVYRKHLDVSVLDLPRNDVLKMLTQIVICLACDATSIWVNEWRYQVSPIFWYTISYMQGIRIRYLQITMHTVHANYRVEILKEHLQALAKRNRPKSIYHHDIWQPYTAIEYEQLNAMRLIYGRLYQIYEHINAYYGWSILLLFISSFTVFVCNAYWCFRVLHQHKPLIRLVHNSATVVALVILVVFHFWYADKSVTNGRRIGCLIFKLVKPLGNKRYNDLVSEFSLQTIHQDFIISAKGFFNLDLNLLGSMVAAIVTYLVILIQFMFSEKTNAENLLKAALKTTTATLDLANFTTTKIMEPLTTTTTTTTTAMQAITTTISDNFNN